MIRLVGFMLIVLGAASWLPGEALGQKKAAKRSDVSDATPDQYALLAKYKEMVGTIRSVTSSTIVLRVEYTPPTASNGSAGGPNAGTNVNRNNTAQTQQIQRQLQQLQRDQIALQASKNPAQAQQRLIQLARDQQRLEIQLYRHQVQQVQHAQQQQLQAMRAKGNSKAEYLDFELPLVEKPAIRRLSLGVEYDEKGNVKEAAAKGVGGLPGFPAKLDELFNGVAVKVYLSPPKPAGAANKKDENGAVLDWLPGNRPQVRMIVVLGDPNAQPAKGNAKKK